MIAALVVLEITDNAEVNLEQIGQQAREAAHRGANLALFPEAALTGLINDGDPAHDLPLGRSIPGPLTDRLASLALEEELYLGIGLLEREGRALYDSAVLIGPDGSLALKYRRIQPQWHGRRADPAVYRQGTEMPTARTPYGTLSFLICGDLFDDEIVACVRALRRDYLLFPFARCFPTGVNARDAWESGEKQEYVNRARLTGAAVLMVNSLSPPELAGGTFGGALAVSPTGEIRAELPLEEPGILLIELHKAT